MLEFLGSVFNFVFMAPLANGLAVSYRLFGQNLGIAIIAFSLILRLVLNPLTKPYMESMKKIRKHQKELDKVKKRHKGDRMKLAQAQKDFYKQKGINPAAGLLPFLLQIVFLIAFFRVFTVILADNGSMVESFNKLLYGPLDFSPDTKINTRFLYLDVTEPDRFNIEGFPPPLPGPVLVAAAVVQFLSSKLSTPYIRAEQRFVKKTKEKGDDMQVAIQSSLAYTFPLVTIVFGITFPSGLALYWLLFSAFQFYQQYGNYGWGGLTPWIEKAGLLKLSDEQNRKTN